ncbi:MAG: M48 family metallopeptidase [Opitutaceae bacterium]|nr:M48 family metallopeptidase [Opitutaceae bacterium]
MVLTCVVVLLLARLGVELVLNSLNRGEVLRNAERAPEAVAAIMDPGAYRRSVDYTLAKTKLSRIELVLDAGVTLAVLLSGILPTWQAAVGAGPESGVWRQAAFLMGVILLLGVPNLPLSWWEQFRLEARFGFNKSTLGLWVMDKVKGTLLGIALGWPLLAGLLTLVRTSGDAWWIFGFALIFGFQLLMLVLYPKLILPLFNKLTPLPQGELRDRLMQLGDRTGFKARAIEVIDGSKRSAHSNAYFTGFGRFRRIVLFDTLIQQLAAEELEAVLAHEVGHYRCGHIPKLILLSAAMLLGGFATIAWLASSAWFNSAFGFAPHDTAASLLLFGLLSGTVTFWFSPLSNHLSRKHEYEADAFAREAMGGPGPLVGALRKLAQKNLSNLTPHPLFSAFYYSHPTLVERERAVLAGKA